MVTIPLPFLRKGLYKNMKFETHFTVEGNDVDVNGICGASRILRYMQEAANRQMKTFGPSNEQLWERGLAFILSRFSMAIHRPICAYDNITVETRALESRGVSFERNARILCGDDVVAELYTVWALVDTASKKLLRVSDIELGFGTDVPLEFEPSRVRIPRDLELRPLGQRPIFYSDLDRNHHMNNTKYPDMLCDFLPNMVGRRVERLAMHFLHEAAPGDVITVFGEETDATGDSWLMRTLNSSGEVGIEAELQLTTL